VEAGDVGEMGEVGYSGEVGGGVGGGGRDGGFVRVRVRCSDPRRAINLDNGRACVGFGS
jgi:hypothetical protein